MSFGDVLKNQIFLLKDSTTNKNDYNAFWNILKRIAVQDIVLSHEEISSDKAVEIYFNILKENEQFIPPYFIEYLPSNGQQRYRVINRNMWGSNSFHKDGLANQPEIEVQRTLSSNTRGDKIFYKKRTCK